MNLQPDRRPKQTLFAKLRMQTLRDGFKRGIRNICMITLEQIIRAETWFELKQRGASDCKSNQPGAG